jgi:hypothetical protein
MTMYPAGITSEYNNSITNHQNHNPVNMYGQTINSPTFPPLPAVIPPQIQATQMYTPFNHYTPPVQQQMEPSDTNYINNADRGQHIHIASLTTSGETKSYED